MDEAPRFYSVLDRDARLVLALSEDPGLFHMTRPPDEDTAPVECGYATIQCYDARAEAEMLRLVFGARDLEELLENLRARGYKVIEGPLQASKIARL